MSDFLPFVVVGLTTGAIYGFAGVGLVLTYRTSGVFNFAHGGVATLAAYTFYELHYRHGLAWPVALVLCVAAVGLAAGLLLERMADRLREAQPVVKVVATVGLLLMLQGIVTLRYGSSAIRIESFLPASTFRLAGVNVGWDQLILVGIGVAATALLTVLLQRSRTGTAMRAVVDDPVLLELTGLDAIRTRRWAWMIGSSVAAIAGILLSPMLGLDPTQLTYLVVQAFGAAAIGRFRSLSMTFIGGLLIAVVAALGQRYATDYPTLLGLPPSLPFIVLFITLAVSRAETFPELGTPGKERRASFTTLPPRIGAPIFALLAAVALGVPHVVGTKLQVWIAAAGMIVVFVSMALLLRVAGQVSLAHAAFVAVGASTFSHLRLDHGAPWGLAVLGAGLAAVPLGVAVAIPASKLPALYLALATFGLGILLERLVYRTFLMYGIMGSRLAPRPAPFDSDTRYFYVAAALAAAASLGAVWLQRSRLGRILRASADSPKAMTAFGASVPTALILVFAVTTFMAAAGGAIVASGTGGSGTLGFTSLHSLLWLAVISITGRNVVSAAVLSAVLVAVVPAYLPGGWTDHQTIAFGVGAIGLALVNSSGWDWVSAVRRNLVTAEQRATVSPVRHRRTQPTAGPVQARLASACGEQR